MHSLSPLLLLFPSLSLNPLHLLSFTSWFLPQSTPEERPPVEGSRPWAVARRVLTAIQVLGLLLCFSVLLFYIFQNCGPRKQDPRHPNPVSPRPALAPGPSPCSWGFCAP